MVDESFTPEPLILRQVSPVPWALLVLTLLAAGVGGVLAYREHQSSMEKISALEAASAALQKEQARLEAQLTTTRNELTATDAARQALSQKLDELRSARETLAQTVSEKDAVIAKLKAQLEAKQTRSRRRRR